MHGLTTIAAIPRTGGAGMALRAETNTRPMTFEQRWGPDPFRYDDPRWLFNRIGIGLASESNALLRGPTPECSLQEWDLGLKFKQQQEEDRLAVLRAHLEKKPTFYMPYLKGMPCS